MATRCATTVETDTLAYHVQRQRAPRVFPVLRQPVSDFGQLGEWHTVLRTQKRQYAQGNDVSECVQARVSPTLLRVLVAGLP